MGDRHSNSSMLVGRPLRKRSAKKSLPLQFVDAGGQALAEEVREEVRAVTGLEPLMGGLQWVRAADEP